LPVLDGIETLKLIRRIGIETKVFLMSGDPGESDTGAISSLGQVEFHPTIWECARC
jgi:hypothetical protein